MEFLGVAAGWGENIPGRFPAMTRPGKGNAENKKPDIVGCRAGDSEQGRGSIRVNRLSGDRGTDASEMLPSSVYSTKGGGVAGELSRNKLLNRFDLPVLCFSTGFGHRGPFFHLSSRAKLKRDNSISADFLMAEIQVFDPQPSRVV